MLSENEHLQFFGGMAPAREPKPPATKRIKVSPSTIQQNYKLIEEGKPELIRPAIVVLVEGQKTIHANRVEILGPSRIIQNDIGEGGPHGARVWIETEAELNLEGVQ